MKVLFIWNVRKELREYLAEALPDVELIFPCEVEPDTDFDSVTEDMYLPMAADADIIVGWRPSKELLREAKKIKLYINPGAGVQHISDMWLELREEGINIPLANGHGNACFTATAAVGLTLSLMTSNIKHHNWMVEGKWRLGDDSAKTIPLRDRKAGFLGYGHVGSLIHKFLSPYRLEFHALRKDWGKLSEEPPTELARYTPDQTDEFLQAVDLLYVLLPSTEETIGSIGLRELDLLGPEGILVHIGRGEVIDEAALYTALKEKRILGAAIDVWYDYRPDEDAEGRKYPYDADSHPFHTLDNIVMSPHRCASPFDDLERWDEVVENARRVKAGRTDLLNLVDVGAGY